MPDAGRVERYDVHRAMLSGDIASDSSSDRCCFCFVLAALLLSYGRATDIAADYTTYCPATDSLTPLMHV